jgi:flagellar biosynthesis protein FlhA
MATTPPAKTTEGGPSSVGRVLALGLVAIVLMLILPVPALLLDVLLALSITLSLLIFVLSISFEKPVEFSTFPTVLLVTTMFRLSLNIATTRLILLHGAEGGDAAGQVIQAFGHFVVGGSYVVGLIIFLILVIINFKVITTGAGRIAEVAARFTLDAMPGKQMAVDNELANGHITEDQARQKRREISEEADFYGAMDGANKFVKGDAVAGLIITAINLVGGILIGVMQGDLTFAESAKTYTILTIGDGLVSQIPALLVSTAAGLIATRSAGSSDLASTLQKQIFTRSEPLLVVGISLCCIGIVPGMPTLAFAALGGGTIWLSRRLPKIVAKSGESATGKNANKGANAAANPDAEPPLSDLMSVEFLALEVGFDLVPLVDRNRGGELIKRVAQIRKQIAQDLGVVVPPMRVRDNLQLGSSHYQLMLSGQRLGGGELNVRKLMAIAPAGGAAGNIPGEKTKDPAFGLPALWINPADRERAEIIGYTTVDPATVAATHITELLKNHAGEFLGRAEAQELLDAFAQRNPKLVEEVIPTLLPLGEVIKVFKRLLAEGVSIRDLRTILEALADHAGKTKDPEVLTEYVRQAMGRALTARYVTGDDKLHALLLDPTLESILRGATNSSGAHGPDPAALPGIVKGLEHALMGIAGASFEPLLVTAPDIRATTAAIVARHAPGLAVLSFRELDPRLTVKSAGVVKIAA